MAKVKPFEEQIALCEAWQQSGLNKTDFCRMNNISLSVFYRWLKKLQFKDDNQPDADESLKSKSISKDDKIRFLKMPISPVSSVNEDLCYLEIGLPNGVNFKVKVPLGSMDKFLAGLLTWK